MKDTKNKTETVLLIDYENVRPVSLDDLADTGVSVKLFVGQSQTKVPIELVTSAQHLGDRLEWIRITGTGKNALDFHIAYWMGLLIGREATEEFVVLSKDTGFDPLIRHVNDSRGKCRRINSLAELTHSGDVEIANPGHVAKAIENLSKVDPKKRPQKRSTLSKHVKAAIKGIEEAQADEIVEALFVGGKVTEESGRVKYHL